MGKYGTLILLLLLALLNSCIYREPCDNTSEPYVYLSFYSDSLSSRYQSVSLLNTVHPSAHFNLFGNDSIPLSITSDSTVFVLESPTRKDTVGIGYTRYISYQARDCGLVVVMKQPRILGLTTIPPSNIRINVEPRERNGLFTRGHKTIYRLDISF
ncbi:MAG: hypothetical protein V4714_14905 [Bacteroidota bacterium]